MVFCRQIKTGILSGTFKCVPIANLHTKLTRHKEEHFYTCWIWQAKHVSISPQTKNSPEMTTGTTSIRCISETYCGPTLFCCMSVVDIMTSRQKKIIEMWDYSFRVSKLKGQGQWPLYYVLPKLPCHVYI